MDSASKKKVLARLRADRGEHEMDIDQPFPKVKRAKKTAKAAKASEGPTPME